MEKEIKGTEKINENKEITAENLEGVSGGKKTIVNSHKKTRFPVDYSIIPLVTAYGAPQRLKTLEEVLKEREKEEQERKKAEDHSNR